MKVEFFGKNLSITDALREKVGKKLNKLEKFTGKMVSARITLEIEKHKSAAELVIHCSHDKIYKAKGTAEDMYLAINDAANAIEQQAKKVKGKILSNRTRKGKGKPLAAEISETISSEPEEPTFRYEKKNDYFIERPVRLEDAYLFLEENNFPFVLFKEIESGRMCVLYNKGRSNYILVEGEK
jgi:putative sigma-54 modulation protein